MPQEACYETSSFSCTEMGGKGHWSDKTGMQVYYEKLLELEKSSCKNRRINTL